MTPKNNDNGVVDDCVELESGTGAGSFNNKLKDDRKKKDVTPAVGVTKTGTNGGASQVTLKGLGLSMVLLSVVVIIASLLGTKPTNLQKISSGSGGSDSDVNIPTTTTNDGNNNDGGAMAVFVSTGPFPPATEIIDNNVTYYMYYKSGSYTNETSIPSTASNTAAAAADTDDDDDGSTNHNNNNFIITKDLPTNFDPSNITDYNTQIVCNDTGFFHIVNNSMDAPSVNYLFVLLWEVDSMLVNQVDHIKYIISTIPQGIDYDERHNIAFEKTKYDTSSQTYTTSGVILNTKDAFDMLDLIKLNLLKHQTDNVVSKVIFDFDGDIVDDGDADTYNEQWPSSSSPSSHGKNACSNNPLCIIDFIHPFDESTGIVTVVDGFRPIGSNATATAFVHEYTSTGFIISAPHAGADGETSSSNEDVVIVNEESSSNDMKTSYVCTKRGFDSPHLKFKWLEIDDTIYHDNDKYNEDEMIVAVNVNKFTRIYHLNNNTSYVAFETMTTTSSSSSSSGNACNHEDGDENEDGSHCNDNEVGDEDGSSTATYSFTSEGYAFYTKRGVELLDCIQFYLERYNPTVYEQITFI